MSRDFDFVLAHLGCFDRAVAWACLVWGRGRQSVTGVTETGYRALGRAG